MTTCTNTVTGVEWQDLADAIAAALKDPGSWIDSLAHALTTASKGEGSGVDAGRMFRDELRRLHIAGRDGDVLADEIADEAAGIIADAIDDAVLDSVAMAKNRLRSNR